MVPIVVPVSMFMLQHFVCVLVTMAFRQVQCHSRQHQYAAQQHQPSGGAFPEAEGRGSANEGREGEHRARARRTKRPLGQKVKAQAQAVARGSNSENRPPSHCCRSLAAGAIPMPRLKFEGKPQNLTPIKPQLTPKTAPPS